MPGFVFVSVQFRIFMSKRCGCGRTAMTRCLSGREHGDRVIVIGAGNAAMDVARTAVRKGSRYVTVYSITEVPAASPKEVEYAKIDGVQFEVLQTAIEIYQSLRDLRTGL